MTEFDLGDELVKLKSEGNITLQRTTENITEKENHLEALIKDSDVTYDYILTEIVKIPLMGERDHYIDILAKEREMKKLSIREDLKRLKTKIPTQNRVEKKQEMTQEEEKEALTLLKNPELLEKFLDASEKIGCVGEEENKIITCLTLTSRKLDDPINLIVKGESSAGKSFLIESVIQFFPKEDILAFTAITPKALYHRKDSLKHKVLIIYERSGAEESDYSIRTLQSEKKLVFSYPCKDPNTGQIETTDVEIEGPIAYIETTTKSRIHPENETRCFDIYIDESEEQTKRIFDAQKDKYLGKKVDKESVLKQWINAQRLLEPMPVLIPFVGHIKFPTKPLRVRRDRPRFLALIEAGAILYQYQREKKEINGQNCIIATIADYTIAFELAGKLLEQSVKGVSPRLKEIVKVAEEFDEEFGRKELREKLPEWDFKTINKYSKSASISGYFEVVSEGGRGKPYRYKFIMGIDDSPIHLLSPEELQASIKECGELNIQISNNRELGIGYFKPMKSLEKTLNIQNDQ